MAYLAFRLKFHTFIPDFCRLSNKHLFDNFETEFLNIMKIKDKGNWNIYIYIYIYTIGNIIHKLSYSVNKYHILHQIYLIVSPAFQVFKWSSRIEVRSLAITLHGLSAKFHLSLLFL